MPVVDDPVGAQGADHVDVGGTGHAIDGGAEGRGQLHGEGADPAGGAHDQDALAGLDPANEPLAIPNTSSPTAKRVTSDPTSTTRPATSSPGTGCFGLVRPNPASRTR